MDVRDYIEANASGFFAALKDWLAIPSISGDPERRDDVRRSAEWLQGHLRGTGFPVVEIWETGTADAPGLPAVFAEWPAADPAAPTIVVYGHHDVQPVDRSTSGTPRRSSRSSAAAELIGRGASDDKGQIFFHLLGLRRHLAADGATTPGGHAQDADRGRGGVRLAALRRAAARSTADRLACDVIVVSDTDDVGRGRAVHVHRHARPGRGRGRLSTARRRPALRLLRRRRAQPAARAGPAPRRPARRDGRVTLPGFYDGVVALTDEERELFARLPFDETAWLATAGSAAPRSARRASRPSSGSGRGRPPRSTACGAATPAPGGKTIVPREAHAKVSFRLVAGQDPARGAGGVRDLRRRAHPARRRGDVSPVEGRRRARASPRSTRPALAALRRAMERAFGTRGAVHPRGRQRARGRPRRDPGRAAGVRRRRPADEDRIHAPNEKAEMPLLLKGAEAAAYLWEEFAGKSPEVGP